VTSLPNVGEDGSYENVSEYIRDLIRRDKERAQALAFGRLKAELAVAFAAPEDSYKVLSASDVINRNQRNQRTQRTQRNQRNTR